MPIYSIIAPLLKRDHCDRVILIHNHPSDITDPSSSDIAFTGKTIQMCRRLYVKFMDHIIIGRSSHFSFNEKGLLSKVEQWVTRDDTINLREELESTKEKVRDLEARLMLCGH